MLSQTFLQTNVNGVYHMVNNKEIVRYVFGESKIIKKNKFSDRFLKQILEADVKNFELNIDTPRDELYRWVNGIWYNGTWKEGIWENGTWEDGIWKNGFWEDGTWEKGIWKDGIWENGTWNNGTWENGYWKDGIWEDGKWIKGKIWNPKTRKHVRSKISPNKCIWSYSYGK